MGFSQHINQSLKNNETLKKDKTKLFELNEYRLFERKYKSFNKEKFASLSQYEQESNKKKTRQLIKNGKSQNIVLTTAAIILFGVLIFFLMYTLNKS